ncbi:MAG TPA: type II toxin-antitoxin system VapC family toxin [Solirubrobacteraceae bacterium]
MITAVDTSVLLDIFGADPTFGRDSAAALRQCIAEGGVIACEAVWAETGASFPDPAATEAAFARVRVDFSPLDAVTSLVAGEAWKEYRRAGGRRERVIADFLIGAHARIKADRLLTRDRGFYRRYFEDLPILDPSR